MKNTSKVTILFLFLVSSFTGYSQIKLASCGLNVTIPSFKQDSAFSDSEQILVRKKFLLPIHLSKSNIEIRLYYYPYFDAGKTVIIACEGRKFTIRHFNIGYQSIPHTGKKYKNTKNLGPLPENPGMDVLVFYERALSLREGTWQQFFQQLTDNHFFDMIDEKEIQKKVEAAHPGINRVGEGATHVQIKIGDSYRNMKFSIGYGSPALDVPEFKNLSNIYAILSKIQ